MHRRQKSELLPVDTEFERTLRNMKKVRVGTSGYYSWIALIQQLNQAANVTRNLMGHTLRSEWS